MKPGLYRHFKGNLYWVLTTVTHSESRELLVVYVPCYVSTEGPVARPLSMFLDEVAPGVPRFEYIGDQ
jgi:hypothetical protein